MLQQELLSRTSLETQKLDLMAEVSNLKLKLTSVEKDRLDYEDRFRDTEGLMQEIDDLRLRVGEMDSERLQYEKKLKSTKDELAALKEQLEEKESEVKRLQEKLVCKMKGEGIEVIDRDENCKKKLKEKNIEVQKMKKSMESLMAANEEKDRKIEDLRHCLSRYKKVQDMVILSQGKKGKEGEYEELPSSISALLEMQSVSDLEKSPPSSPVTGSPSHDVLNTSVPEELHMDILEVSVPSFSPISKDLETSDRSKSLPISETLADVNDGKTILDAALEVQMCDNLL
ncbi:liprin-beta-1-like isoform X4 [Petaurus breviceps papuanus]|uniref:liprin-beta-1-like isoform X4 n=1 Tax=Petaurus breviceps papuanus TaxID=3040969 RepID=UPI0036DACD6C